MRAAPRLPRLAPRALVLLAVAGLLLVLAQGVLAQDWSGANGFRVTVTDEGGLPLPGVTVVVLLAEDGRSGGPPPLLTDERGQVEVGGLAAGEWRVELRREGFMIVSSYLRLEDGKLPRVGFTSRQRTGPFWAAMSVGYTSPGVDAAVASAGSARALGQAQRRAERRARQRERQQERGDVARVVTPPAPIAVAEAAPEPPPAPAVESSGEESPSQPPRAAVAAPPVEVAGRSSFGVEPSADAARDTPQDGGPGAVAEAEPVAAPEVDDVPEPAAAAAPAPTEFASDAGAAAAVEPPPVRLLPNRTLLRAGACPECAAGEWSVAGNWPAAPRTSAAAPCAADLGERMEQVAELVARALPARFRPYAGALADPSGNDVLRLLPPAERETVKGLLAPILDPERSCQVVSILLPEGARFVGFQYEAGDLTTRGSCLPEQVCEIGDSAWRGNPVIHRHEHGTLVYGVFENRSPEVRREANLKLYFRPPRGWLPPR